MKLDDMTKDERSLLLFLETCAVDYGGKVDGRRINKEDIDTARKWNTDGFVKFGRIKFHDIAFHHTHWCELSDEAWAIAHEERRARYERLAPQQTFNKASIK